MLLKTGMPSAGHPVPVIGLQFGDEKGRVPTSVIPFGPTVPLKHVGLPPGVPLYGNTSPAQLIEGTLNGWGGSADKVGAAGITVPGGIKYELSSPNGPQPKPRLARPRQVWMFPEFRSRDANSRCAWVPTYATRNTIALPNWRSSVKLYWSA